MVQFWYFHAIEFDTITEKVTTEFPEKKANENIYRKRRIQRHYKQKTKMTSIRQMLTKQHRSSVMLFITVVGGLLCYLPIFTKSNLENSIVSEAIRNGPLFRIGIVASISLATPFFINNLADLVMNNLVDVVKIFLEGKKLPKKKKTTAPANNMIIPILSTVEKLFFISGILMIPIMSCFTQWNQSILMIACTACAQKHVVFGVIFTSFNRFDDRYFPTSITYFMLFLSTVGSILRSFAINACATISYNDCRILPGGMFSTFETLIRFPILILFLLYWLISVVVTGIYGEKVPTWCRLIGFTAPNTSHPPRVGGARPTKKTLGPDEGFLLSFRSIYAIAVIAWGIFVITNTGFFTSTGYSYSHANDKAMLLNCVPYIMFELTGLFFALRGVKHQTVSALLALIDAKKTYVRYISHELRTPLSAANSGLQMLQAQLSATASTNPIDEERLDTVNDVCTAINTTVDILDDLLTFEKMESGKYSYF